MAFQSTRPARGATVYRAPRARVHEHFNPRAPRGARRLQPVSVYKGVAISIHAPREGRDRSSARWTSRRCYFNPRAPRGARPRPGRWSGCQPCYFNPRAPRGARPTRSTPVGVSFTFQSTRPARGATFDVKHARLGLRISIHAPREGRDRSCAGAGGVSHGFQSTRPARGATSNAYGADQLILFQSTRPARGATAESTHTGLVEYAFQSTRPARGATAKVNKFLCTFLQKRHGFQIFLRKTLPFKAFCRLQIGKNFSICGANRCGNFCELLLRTIRSSVLPEGRSACSQNAQFYSHTFSRDNRNADCLFPDP